MSASTEFPEVMETPEVAFQRLQSDLVVVLEHIRDLLPAYYRVTLVARCTHPELAERADVVLTSESDLSLPAGSLLRLEHSPRRTLAGVTRQ